ncbi:MAG: FHA domain-containing protein [Planctomycetes bacterium]|nr:FHA domain-containing protein [Planctomycetota bacterium]
MASRTTDGAPIVPESGSRLSLVPIGKGGPGTPIECRRCVTLLGSRNGCKIVLKRKTVAAAHVAIVNTGAHIYAVDLVTKHGAQLNGLKMEHEELNDGDMLQIATWSFRVDIAQPMRSDEADLHTFDLDPTPHIVALEHVESGRILQSIREVCVVGRRSGCDIVISDSQVSRTHCLLFDYLGHPAVYDLLSRNETWVNDNAVAYHELKDDDLLGIGDTKFRLRLVESKVGKVGSNGKSKETAPVSLESRSIPPDEIDIESTEKSQRWRIVENLEKATRKR